MRWFSVLHAGKFCVYHLKDTPFSVSCCLLSVYQRLCVAVFLHRYEMRCTAVVLVFSAAPDIRILGLVYAGSSFRLAEAVGEGTQQQQ